MFCLVWMVRPRDQIPQACREALMRKVRVNSAPCCGSAAKSARSPVLGTIARQQHLSFRLSKRAWRTQGVFMSLLLIILLVLLLAGGGFGYTRYGALGGTGIVGTVLIVILVLYLLGALGAIHA
jgi:hypothetical protein